MTDTTKLRRVAMNLDRKGKPESAKLVAGAAQEIDELRAEVARLKPAKSSFRQRAEELLRGLGDER